MRIAKSSRQRSARAVPPASSYWHATREPLYCLVFLLPLVATYEFGALILRLTSWPERQLVAERLLRDLLGWLGASGVWLPGIAVVLTLAIWHVLSRRSWVVRAWVPALMLAESVLLAAPLLVLGRLSLQASASAPASVAEQLVLALGAGIFEELVFRLGLVSLVLVLMVEVLRAPRPVGEAVAIVVGALLFALAHYPPVGGDEFAWGSFLIRTAGGAYLSLVFLWRGVGVSTGAHAAYNVAVAVL